MFKKYLIILYAILFSMNYLFAEIKIYPTDGSEDDRFGQSVLITDDWIFIGANRDYTNNINSGSVYIYNYDQNMNIVLFEKIIPSDYSSDQFFGKSLSYNNDWLAVSSIYDEDNGIKSGAVYIYHFNGESFIEHSKITAFDGSSFDRFGYSIDIYSNKLIVGSIYDDDRGENSGAAYLYEYQNDNWDLIDKICPEHLSSMDLFGYSVSMNDSYLAVSSPQSSLENSQAGAVDIFSLEDYNFLEFNTIIPEDLGQYNQFGKSLEMDSTLLAIGSIYDDENSINAGSVYIYRLIDGSWVFNDKIFASDGIANDNFGLSLSLNNNWISIGSIDDDNGIDSGSLYLFESENGIFIEKAKLSSSDGNPYDEFSSSLSLKSDFLVVGAKFDDDNGNNSGSAYFYKYKGCLDINACNYDDNSILAYNSLCEYSLNGFECDGQCFQEIDECGICGGQGSSGDINIDDEINIIDVVIIVDFIFNYELITNMCIVDLNDNGSLNITDIVLLVESILTD